MNYELKLEHFEGPLDKLLALVEEKKLEITLISLAKVTADFLDYVEKEVTSELLADFLSIASKLLLIKSKILLPTLELEAEEEAEIKDLETRLKIYAEFKKTHSFFKENWQESFQIFSREYLMSNETVFYPPANLKAEDLRNALTKIVSELEKLFKPVAIVKKEIINLKQKIEEILGRLTERPALFKELAKNGERKELIVLFLAILHMIKNQLIHAEQTGSFEEIKILRKKPENTINNK